MSACDDLTDLIEEFSDFETCEIASMIIAAGFHRDRTIITAEELDALPVGTVLVEGDHATPDPFLGSLHIATMPGVFHRFPDGWHVVAGDGARQVPLPATVLWKPEDDNE